MKATTLDYKFYNSSGVYTSPGEVADDFVFGGKDNTLSSFSSKLSDYKIVDMSV